MTTFYIIDTKGIHGYIQVYGRYARGLSRVYREYVEGMPSLKHPISFVCKKCDHENEQVLEGIQNFF